jgi:hypothetical protein
MNKIPSFPERLQEAFSPTSRGVIGVVDELLGLCREQGLQLGWHANQCQVREVGKEPQNSTELPLPKSVFRAILARVAALCNERSPDSISPYGGEGELSVGTNPPEILHVVFTNTPDEQRMVVTPKTPIAGNIQAFELTMDNPEDQDELNRRYCKPGEPDRRTLPKIGGSATQGESTNEPTKSGT